MKSKPNFKIIVCSIILVDILFIALAMGELNAMEILNKEIIYI